WRFGGKATYVTPLKKNFSAPRKTNLPSTLGRPSPSRLSGVTLVLTLQSQRNEDHLPYLSQSEYPGKGTPVGRRSDDPRRKHTGDGIQVIRRAVAIGVSAACREAGISRTLFYRWEQRLSRYGVEG